MCFNFAVYEEGLVEPYENPTLGVVMPIYDMTLDETPAYNTDEIKKITNECLKKTSTGKYVYKYGPFFLFMLNTGLREGEACALLKSDVNLQDRLVSVNKNIISVRTERENNETHWIKKVKNTPKTKNSIRYVPLNVGAVKYAEIIFEQFKDGDMFVYTINGGFVNPSALNKYLDKKLKNAGVGYNPSVHSPARSSKNSLNLGCKYKSSVSHGSISSHQAVVARLWSISPICESKTLQESDLAD